MQARLTMSVTASGNEQLRIQLEQPSDAISRGMILLAFDSLFSSIDARHRVNFTFYYEEVSPRHDRVRWDAELQRFLVGRTAVPQRFFQVDGNEQLLFCLTQSLYQSEDRTRIWYLQPCCTASVLQDFVNGLPGVVVRRRPPVTYDTEPDVDDDADESATPQRGGRMLALGEYDDYGDD